MLGSCTDSSCCFLLLVIGVLGSDTDGSCPLLLLGVRGVIAALDLTAGARRVIGFLDLELDALVSILPGTLIVVVFLPLMPLMQV